MRKGGDSSHTRASLVFENNRLELGSRCHRRKHRYGFMGLFRRSFANRGPNVLQLEEECCITCSNKFSHQPHVHNWTAVLFSHRPFSDSTFQHIMKTLDRNTLMDVFFCFSFFCFFFFPKKSYIEMRFYL